MNFQNGKHTFGIHQHLTLLYIPSLSSPSSSLSAIWSFPMSSFCIFRSNDLDLMCDGATLWPGRSFSTTSTSHNIFSRVLLLCGTSCVTVFCHGVRPQLGRKKWPWIDFSRTCMPSLDGSHSVVESLWQAHVWRTRLPMTPGMTGVPDKWWWPKSLVRA